MRRRSDNDDDAMDSLLDTMTNVVGILVIVLVVTQLGVRDAVQRIEDENPVAVEDAEKTRQENLTRHEEIETQQKLLDSMSDDGAALVKQQISEMKELSRQEREALAKIQTERKNEQQKLESQNKKIAEQNRVAKKSKDEHKKLNEKLKTSLSELARLEAILDKTPPRKELPAETIQMPDPRPAPEGLKALYVICSDNKIYPLDLDHIRKLATNRAKFVISSNRLDRDKQKGISAERFVREFNERPINDDYFIVRMKANGVYPRLVFEPKRSGGESDRAVLSDRSRFRRRLSAVNKDDYYIRFYVKLDSFDIYITTRRVVSDAGLLAGWDPQGTAWKFETNLGGSIKLGPPAKWPKPAKNPVPPAPKPNVID